MADRGLVDLYVDVCEELALEEGERRRLWFFICEEIERVQAQLRDAERPTDDEIRVACQQTDVPALRTLAARARRPPLRPRAAQQKAAEPWSDDPKEVLVRYWKTIEDLVSRSRHKMRTGEEEADTVESRVKEKLFENDCEIVRNFRHESSFKSYLNVIVQRTFHDVQVERAGKWHYSAAAERLGPLAKELERMVYRDNYQPSEAISVLLTAHPETTRAELESMLPVIPVKQPRPTKVAVDHVVQSLPAASEDFLSLSGERMRLSRIAAAAVRRFLQRPGALDDSDRALLRYLFEGGLKISTIAKILQKPHKGLYRRRDELFAQLRHELEQAGITRGDAADLYDFIGKLSIFSFAKKRR